MLRLPNFRRNRKQGYFESLLYTEPRRETRKMINNMGASAPKAKTIRNRKNNQPNEINTLITPKLKTASRECLKGKKKMMEGELQCKLYRFNI